MATEEQALPASLAPPPATAPNCIICGRLTTLLTTRASNLKGNAVREYFKCNPCKKFHCFSDTRGNDPRNPLCRCGASSITQISGAEKRVARGVRYVCRLGRCDFYDICRDDQKRQVTVDENFMDGVLYSYNSHSLILQQPD
jgi:hypothetical protein